MSTSSWAQLPVASIHSSERRAPAKLSREPAEKGATSRIPFRLRTASGRPPFPNMIRELRAKSQSQKLSVVGVPHSDSTLSKKGFWMVDSHFKRYAHSV